MPRKPYSGHLAKPIPELSWTDDELLDLLGAQFERLFDHYEIPDGPDMWKLLAFALASDDGGVPGFQFAKPLGAPPYPPDDDAMIVLMLDVAKERGESISQAARDLADWGAAEARLRGLSAKQIRVRYYHLQRDPNARKRVSNYLVAYLEAEMVRMGVGVYEGKHSRVTVSKNGQVHVEKLL